MSKTKVAVVGLVLLILSGCAQKPRQVEAGVKLVEPTNLVTGERIPQKYWSELNNPVTTKIDANGMLIDVGKLYTSGLGQECRSLQISGDPNENRTRIACSVIEAADNTTSTSDTIKVWYLTNNIVETSTIIKIQ
ncbi:hypothetical protein JCM19239_3944 [Vibrio variabilis]|uniref:Lipoprotein n=1 Tax=Vibrio variabilis TaxID=990271 RepID=A0ABQ0J628_9VIBR|nr:hypothetical protein JCM19239_3944 [Vibrio variabilis]